MFEAVVLMGGFGTRLQTISDGIPKPMMPVGGIPFVYKILEKLVASGCTKIILSLHYKASVIKRQIQTDNPVKCHLIFATENEPLGTGGALKFAAKYIQSDKFIAVNGDTFSNLDYQKFHQNMKDNEFSIAGVRIRRADRYGSLSIDDQNKLINIQEKGLSGPAVINSGTYLITKSSIMSMKSDIFSLEKDYIPIFYSKAEVMVFDGYFIDIGIPSDYNLACSYFS